jgi:glycosyltransferase involved in cell wall biosynthesis
MIHVYCRYFGYQGEQQHGRNFTNALHRYLPLAMHSWDEIPAPEDLPDDACEMLVNARKHVDENISLGVGPMARMCDLKGDHKIAFTVWETTLIPPPKIAPLQCVDEIWTPSAWGKELLIRQGIDASKIHVIPEGVDVNIFQPVKRVKNSPVERPFRFLCVGKWEVRKGMDKLLRAWSKAFSGNENVELVLHCHNPYIDDFNLRKILTNISLDIRKPVIVSDPVNDISELVALYNSSDAFVLPTRAEGWGLPIIEAMACAKPVIVTDYSGHREYANQSNAYLIGVERMIDVQDPYFFESELDFGQWADPDLDHLVELLRQVYQNPHEARQKGRQARIDVCSQWGWDHAAMKAASLLDYE